MALAPTFIAAVAALPEDWSTLSVDLRIGDERRYVESCLLLTTVNAHPYSKHDWHWNIAIARSFGHAAAVDAVIGAFQMLDDSAIEGEFVIREMRTGRAPVAAGWGRPESVRREFQRLHHQ